MKKYIILLLLLGFILPLKAQFVKNQSAKIIIVTGSYVKSGEWTNTNATSETNLSGELNLTQNLVNEGVFVGTTSSLLSFTGTSLQNVQGSTPISLYNMQINKLSNNVNLQNSVTLSNLLSLTNGRLISETAPILFSPTALNPIETNANRIIGTATMQNRPIGTAALSNFLGITLNAGADIGSLSITRYTGSQGIITIAPERSIASTWSLNATNNVSRDITYDWLSNLDNGLNLTNLQLKSSAILAGAWADNGGIIDVSTRSHTATNLLNSNWSLFGVIPTSNPTLPTPASPTGFTATAVSPTQINLDWNSATSNITEYQIFQNGILIATLPIGTTTYQVTGLNPNTLYSFTIVAVNRGNGQIKTSAPASARDWTFPESPSLLSLSEVCTQGKATLKVISTGSVYRVYDELTGGNLLLESSNGSFELPFTTQSTTFYVSVVGFGGDESARLPVSVTIADSFEALILGENVQTSCENSLLLEAQAVEGASFYQWYLNNQLFSEGQTLLAPTSGYYKLLVRKGNCNVVSDEVLVRLNQNPIAQIRETNGIRFCDNGTLNAVSTNSNATYEWLLNNVVIGQGTSISVSQTGIYTLQVTQNECTSNATVSVIITTTPQTPVLVASETTICPNTETTLSVQNAENGVMYQWFRNGRNTRQTGTSISTSVKGNYRVVATSNAICSATSSELQINLFDTESIYLRLSEDRESLFVENLAGSQNGIASIEWYFEGELNSVLGTTNQITPTEDGNYSALVTTQNGCKIQTRTVYFTVPKIPIITGEEDIKIDTFKIYPNPNNGTFKVHFGISLTQNIQVIIFDGIGRKVTTQTFEKGNQEFDVNLKNQPSGIYLIHFNQNGATYSKQIIIE